MPIAVRGMEIEVKKLLPISFSLLAVSLVVFYSAYASNSIPMSIELKGGTLITVRAPYLTEASAIEREIKAGTGLSVQASLVKDFSGNVWGAKAEVDKSLNADEVKKLKEFFVKKGTLEGDIQIESVGPALSEMFVRQSIKAVVFAFLFMAAVIFLRFRTFVPSFAVVLSAFSDITETVAAMTLLGIPIAPGSIVALLLLIGYSVDTDILLTTRLIKQRGWKSIDEGIESAFLTGITMQTTTIGAMLVLRLLSTSRVLDDIATVILIGLIFDVINTWITNTSILKIYLERGGKIEA